MGVDVNPKKYELAKSIGCTDCINPLDHKDTPMQQVLVAGSPTGFGYDYTFDCTGNVMVMRTALEAAHRGWGKCTREHARPPATKPSAPPGSVTLRPRAQLSSSRPCPRNRLTEHDPATRERLRARRRSRRRGRGGQGDLDAALPVHHGPPVPRHRLRRLEDARRHPDACREVHLGDALPHTLPPVHSESSESRAIGARVGGRTRVGWMSPRRWHLYAARTHEVCRCVRRGAVRPTPPARQNMSAANPARRSRRSGADAQAHACAASPLVRQGEIAVDHYITHTFNGVGETPKALHALHGGDCLRAVVMY